MQTTLDFEQELFNSNVKVEFATLGQTIREIMSSDVRARNSDKFLSYRIIKRCCPRFNLSFAEFKALPDLGSVKRIRAKIQNENRELLPTEEAVKLRRLQRQRAIYEVMR